MSSVESMVERLVCRAQEIFETEELFKASLDESKYLHWDPMTANQAIGVALDELVTDDESAITMMVDYIRAYPEGSEEAEGSTWWSFVTSLIYRATIEEKNDLEARVKAHFPNYMEMCQQRLLLARQRSTNPDDPAIY